MNLGTEKLEHDAEAGRLSLHPPQEPPCSRCGGDGLEAMLPGADGGVALGLALCSACKGTGSA